MSVKNIVITGGAGFIGSHVVRLFVKKYPRYQIINLDKRIESSIKFFESMGFREHLVQHEMVMPLTSVI